MSWRCVNKTSPRLHGMGCGKMKTRFLSLFSSLHFRCCTHLTSPITITIAIFNSSRSSKCRYISMAPGPRAFPEARPIARLMLVSIERCILGRMFSHQMLMVDSDRPAHSRTRHAEPALNTQASTTSPHPSASGSALQTPTTTTSLGSPPASALQNLTTTTAATTTPPGSPPARALQLLSIKRPETPKLQRPRELRLHHRTPN